MALGLAFAIAPSGLLFRIWSTYLGGPERPPDLLIVNDSWGLTLMAGLSMKEVPFLFLMVPSALPQADADRSMIVARSLGYGPVAGWLKVVLPRVYPQIRLPVLAVLAYGISAGPDPRQLRGAGDGGDRLLEAFMGALDTPENRARFIATIPLGRMSTPKDIANACLYLASDESEFITGVVLEVDGGRTI